MNVAVQTVPGQIVNVDLDMEDGILVYEMFIMAQNNKIFEVEVHARTGNIIKIEQENDFDFDWTNKHVTIKEEMMLRTTTLSIPFRIVGIIKGIQVYNKLPTGC